MPRTVHRYELERLNRYPYQFNPDGISRLYKDRVVLDERFYQRPGLNADSDASGTNTFNTAQAQLIIDANRNWEVAGVNMTTALSTFSSAGGVTITTAGASADSAILQPHQNTAASAWKATLFNTAKQPTFETVIVTAASVASLVIYAGLKLSNVGVVATDDDQAYFRYSGTGNWTAVHSRADADTSTDTGVAVAASTAYRLVIKVDSSRRPHFYVNGVEIGASGADLAALTDNVNLIPFIGVLASTGAAKAVTVKGITCSRTF